MKKAFGEYKWLAGGARTRGSLWEGRDHLLYIESTGVLAEFTESYRRLDYSKIRAVVFGRTSEWYATIVAQVLFALLFGWLEVEWVLHRSDRLGNDYAPWAAISAPFMLIVLPALIVNLVKGPTCKLKIHTAVQVLHVKPVKRLKDAKRIVARVSELCLQQQGGAPVEMRAATDSNGTAAPVVMKKPFAGSPFMLFGFLGILVGGGMAIGEMFVDSVPYFVADVLLNICGGVAIVVGLVRCSGVELQSGLKGAVWGSIVNLILGFVVGFGLYMYGSITIGVEVARNRRGIMAGQDVEMRLLSWFAHLGFNELGWAGWLVIVVGGLNIFFALLGLPFVVRRYQAAHVATPVPPVMPSAVQPSASQPEWASELPPVEASAIKPEAEQPEPTGEGQS